MLGPLGLGLVVPFGEVLAVTCPDAVAEVGFGFIAFDSTLTLDRLSGPLEAATPEP